MKTTLSTIAALAIIIGSGLVHGAWTNRWRTSAALTELAARLDSVPTVLGDWSATSQAIPARQLAIAGAVGQVSRAYTNPAKSQTVSVMLLCGLPGNISTHTPDACYPGAGYSLGMPSGMFRSMAIRHGPRSSRLPWPAGPGPTHPVCGSTGPGMGRKAGRHPGTLAGRSLQNPGLPSCTSCGKRVEPSRIPRTILRPSSLPCCSRNSTA